MIGKCFREEIGAYGCSNTVIALPPSAILQNAMCPHAHELGWMSFWVCHSCLWSLLLSSTHLSSSLECLVSFLIVYEPGLLTSQLKIRTGNTVLVNLVRIDLVMSNECGLVTLSYEHGQQPYKNV